MPPCLEVEPRELWNAEAAAWAKKPDADPRAGFLKRLLESPYLADADRQSLTILDIGCGPGRFAGPLAKRCRLYVGIDISERMIAAARERAQAAGLENVSFHLAGFDEFDSQETFDIVFANNCPGLVNEEDFARMSALSRGACFWQSWIERRDDITEAAYAALGLRRPAAFSTRLPVFEAIKLYLEKSGVAYALERFDDPHDNIYTLEEAASRAFNRMPAEARTLPDAETRIREALMPKLTNARIRIRTQSTSAFAVWHPAKHD